jgi:hypothetical protein
LGGCACVMSTHERVKLASRGKVLRRPTVGVHARESSRGGLPLEWCVMVLEVTGVTDF